MNGWYVQRNEQKYGPYSSTQLVEMAQKGQVLPLDWVAQGEGGKWMPASQVKGLFPAPATVVPPLMPAAVVVPPLPTTVVPPLPASASLPALTAAESMNMARNLLGAIPASLFRPGIGMIVVIGLGLLASFFCGSLILFLFSFIHIAAAVACIVLAVRLQKFLYAPLSALLTMTVWGWYCLSGVPTIISILGLLVGIAVGTWAMFEFLRPETRRQFADPSIPSRLDRLSIPVLAGILGGGPLILILGIGLLAGTGDAGKAGARKVGSGTPGAGSGDAGASSGSEIVSEDQFVSCAKAIAAQRSTNLQQTVAVLKRWQKDFNMSSSLIAQLGRDIRDAGEQAGLTGDRLLNVVDRVRTELGSQGGSYSSQQTKTQIVLRK